MSRLPNQWISWDQEYVTWDAEDSASDGSGQFLYALKDTVVGDRQVVLEGGTDRGIIAVVDFAGHNRKRGSIYYAWGAVTDLREPVDASSIAADPILSKAFKMRKGRADIQHVRPRCDWTSSPGASQNSSFRTTLRRRMTN